jgi:pimeloyl-ACP methyl ester carboxylesterase
MNSDNQSNPPSAKSTDIDWTFEGTWPYEPKWFQTDDGAMHYIDEGPKDAPPVVLVHGNPTWGYLYRHFIPPLLEAGYRVIVPDHLGFGRSEKPNDPELYHVDRQAERFEVFMESLELEDVTLVPQDWGGPIGLSWAGHHPERVAGLFILNTFAHKPLVDFQPPLAVRLFRTPGVGELLVKGLHIFVRGFLFGQGTGTRLSKLTRRAYLAPHPTWSSRTGVLVFPRDIPVTVDAPLTPFLEKVELGMESLRERPVFLAWGNEGSNLHPGFHRCVLEKDFSRRRCPPPPQGHPLPPRGRSRRTRACPTGISPENPQAKTRGFR